MHAFTATRPVTGPYNFALPGQYYNTGGNMVAFDHCSTLTVKAHSRAGAIDR